MAVILSHHHFNSEIDPALHGNKVRSNRVLLNFRHLKLNLSNVSLVKEKMKLQGSDRKPFDSEQLSPELFTAAISPHIMLQPHSCF